MAASVTVFIGAEEFVSYTDRLTVDSYAAGAAHGGAWRDEADNAAQERACVTATRLLDRQRWLGAQTASSQALAWPRTGTGVSGVVDSAIPDDITDAANELAIALLADAVTVQDEQTTAQKLERIKAGSVELTYFRGAEGPGHRFPLIVQELLRDYLTGSVAVVQGEAVGVGGVSSTADDFGHTGGI